VLFPQPQPLPYKGLLGQTLSQNEAPSPAPSLCRVELPVHTMHEQVCKSHASLVCQASSHTRVRTQAVHNHGQHWK
jgi:hypothetical protein